MKQLIALVGVRFRGPEMEELLRQLPQGEPLELKREPMNAIDHKAVQVWARGRHLGYLKSSQNKSIAGWMDTIRNAKGRYESPPARLALDGGKWPMVEIDV